MKLFISKKVLSLFLCVALLLTCLPLSAMAAVANSAVKEHTADDATVDLWKDFFLPGGNVSTENAGGVWMDKSVYADADAFAGKGITMDDKNAFLVTLSAMATNMTVTGMSHVPADTMLVLDVSGSMGSGQNDVAAELVEAANTSIHSLLSTNSHSRVGVVLYASEAVVMLPLGRYTTTSTAQNADKERYPVYLSFSNNRVSVDTSVVYEGTSDKPAASSKAVNGGTYIQAGLTAAADHMTQSGVDTTISDPVLGTIKRKPIILLMSDGAPTFGNTDFQSLNGSDLGNGSSSSAALGFVTQLSAAHTKKRLADKYGTSALFYTIGLGVSNNAVALSVLDPANADASVAVNDFWDTWNRTAAGKTITVQSGSFFSREKTVTKIDGLTQNYTDYYINVENDTSSNHSLGDLLKDAFDEIVGVINLQSRYSPTLISQVGEHHSGFITFVDKVGEYMAVSDIKGILINDRLYSGADLASNFVAGGGNLGTFDNPTELGHKMIAAVRQRIGLADDDATRTLVSLAYEHGQIRYNGPNDFSNYIGWYADKDSNFLGFYHEGVTHITDPTAVYTIKSYGYLGVEHDSDMMYATVQVRHNIVTGEETVAFAVPASLIPVMTYEVTLDENNDLKDIQVSGAQSPIRLVYEVGLDSHINQFNLKEHVSAEYLAENTDADGNVVFYTNDWEHTNQTGYNTVNTYGYFNPSRQNDRYYFTADAPVYTAVGQLYEGSAAPAQNGTYYHAYTVYEKNGNNLSKKTAYRQISAPALTTAVKTEGTDNWHIPAGNVRVNLSGYTINKDQNKTASLTVANQPFVDVFGHSVNDANHSFYVGATLGNNGRLALAPQTGIKLTKTMAAGAAAPTGAFTFYIHNESNTADGRTYPALRVTSNGSEAATEVTFSRGSAAVQLQAGETLYIGGLQDGHTFRIEEQETAAYLPTAGGLTADGKVTVSDQTVSPVSFVNTDRKTGNVTVTKEVRHDFGTNYPIPADLTFTMQVTLQGIGTANATFDAVHTNGSYDEIVTDANGRFTVQLKHNESLEVHNLPDGTVVTVVEQNPPAGFTPAYVDNGEAGDGSVTVAGDATVSVVVENRYAAAEVYPVNITVTGSKQLVGRDWQAGDSFTFKLEKLVGDDTWQPLGDSATATAANKTFAFDNAFAGERYTAAGTYYYRVVEMEPATPLGGVTYDKTVHSFSVIVGDADMDGQLEITNVKTDRPDSTTVTATQSGFTVNAAFVNRYSAAGAATVTIDVSKHIANIGGAAKSLAGFTFGLFDTAGQQVGNALTTTERGFARFVLTYSADELNASEETFSYVLREIAPNPVPAGWTYSTETVPVTVKVRDTGHGTISAVVYSGTQEPANAGSSMAAAFTNTYNPADDELPIDFVTKVLDGRDLAEGEFTFEVQKADGTKVLDGTNKADGTVVFNGTLKFAEVGTSVFRIVETGTDGNGVTLDKTVHHVVVTVTDDNGVLHATYAVEDEAENTIVFLNTYKPKETTYTISGVKNLSGRTLLNDEFAFVLTEALNADGDVADDAKTYEAHNEFGGKFTFPTITYTKAGTYYYVVSERQNPGNAYGVRYDTAKHVVAVTVTDKTDVGELAASANLGEDDIVFRNVYEASPISKGVPGNKTLLGKSLVDGQFRFELWESDEQWAYVNNAAIQTVQNDADGHFAFNFVDYRNNNAAEFTKAGTYHYLVREVDGGETVKGITYDATVYRVRVEITDDLLGRLHATVHIYDSEGVPQEEILFENRYAVTGDTTLTLGGTKTLDGKAPTDEDFEFELFAADGDYAPTGNALQKITQDADGKFAFTLTYTPEDIADTPYHYVVKEVHGGETIDGIIYDATVYRIEVLVEDNGEGGVKHTAVIRKGDTPATSLDFANVTATSKEEPPVDEPTDGPTDEPTDEPTPDKPPVQEPKPTAPSSPQTGDGFPVALWFAVLFVSGGGAIALYFSKRKRTEENT